MYATEDIRNIALVGQAGSGKTTLAEALLFRAGAIANRGSIERGNTVCDYEPEEQRYQHSLSPAIASLEYEGKHINIIDTPGYPDFLGQTLSILPAVETIVLVINAQNGVEAMSRRLLAWAGEQHFCRMVVVNKIDAAEGQLAGLLEQIQETFGKECLPLNLPGHHASEVTDCFFQPGGEADFSSVSAAHTSLVDQVVEVDEKLMEVYLEQGDISPEQLHDPFEQALRNDHLIPVCFTSAREGTGVKELLDVIVRLMPNPREGNPRPFLSLTESGAKSIDPQPDPDKHVLAHVFRTTFDPFVGKLGIFRVHQGTISKDTQLFVGDRRKAFKVGHLFKLQGREHVETPACTPGDICAIAKVEDVHLDAVLHDSHDEDNVRFQSVKLPEPMVGLAIEPQSRGDEQKISEALDRLVAEDPCLQVEHNTSANETVLRGLGELHLRVALEKLKDRYHVDVHTHAPSIAYRETITQPAEGHYRHKKQTGGAGQFGEVFLRVEPLDRGAGFEFANKVVGGAIPGNFIPAVEKGVRQALSEGIAGYPVQDIRVTVYDGKFHAVDSNEVSFVIAGRNAFRDAYLKANPLVLEPIVDMRVAIPNSQMGDITGDLSARRGRITDTSMQSDDRITVVCQAPLAELEDYQSRLKSLTGGEGSYSMEFSRYEPVPFAIQQRLERHYRPKQEA